MNDRFYNQIEFEKLVLFFDGAEVYNVTWDDLIAAKWPMSTNICKLCNGKARKLY